MSLSSEHEICKPIEPGINVQRLVCRLELRVVVLASTVDQERKRGEARLSGTLRQRLLQIARPIRPLPSSNGWMDSK